MHEIRNRIASTQNKPVSSNPMYPASSLVMKYKDWETGFSALYKATLRDFVGVYESACWLCR